jgi:hypothetical protein
MRQVQHIIDLFYYIYLVFLGNVYIADNDNNRVRKVTVSTGIITTFAGSSTSSGFSGDNGAATSAKLNLPSGVTLDDSLGASFCLNFITISLIVSSIFSL